MYLAGSIYDAGKSSMEKAEEPENISMLSDIEIWKTVARVRNLIHGIPMPYPLRTVVRGARCGERSVKKGEEAAQE